MNMVWLCHLQKGVGCVGAVWIQSTLDGIFKSSLMFPVRFHFTFNPEWTFPSPPLSSLHHLPYGGVDCPHWSPLQECLRALSLIKGLHLDKIHLRNKKKKHTQIENLICTCHQVTFSVSEQPTSDLITTLGVHPRPLMSNVWISISRHHQSVPHSVRFLWFPIRGIEDIWETTVAKPDWWLNSENSKLIVANQHCDIGAQTP